jgi:excisionase family DNA binding protein
MSKTAVENLFEQLFTKPEYDALIRAALRAEVKPMAYYRYDEAATLLDLGLSTINRAVNTGQLRPSYFGATPRLRGDELIRWSESGGKTGRSKADFLAEKKRRKAA